MLGIKANELPKVTKSISRLLAASRKRNNASNRAEFLQSAAEKRRKLNDTGNSEVASAEVPGDVAVPSCARTDARPQNRELQMKYDIVKNEDGPLKRTVKRKSDKMDVDPPGYGQSRLPNGSSKVKMELTAERHPGLAARFTDIETHLAVRYGKCSRNVNPLHFLTLRCSAFASSFVARSNQISGRSHHEGRKGASTMGGIAL